MSLEACIPGLVERGEITREKGEEMRAVYRALKEAYDRDFGEDAAAGLASEGTIKQLEDAALRKKLNTARQVSRQQALLSDIATYDGGKRSGGPIDPAAAAAAFDRDGRARYMNAEGLRKAIERRAFGYMDEILQRFHTNVLGQVRHAAELADVVRELFGHDTGSLAAKEMAEAWTQAAEMLRVRFNAAGGAIGKLQFWGLPQAHDALKVRASTFEEWRGFILPLLDRERMIDERTGLAFTDDAMEKALGEIYKTIRSDGWFKRAPGSGGRGMIANRRAESRFLLFRDADGWMAYQAKFGTGTPYDAMIGHVRGMARDIAAMERFGPNPDATVRWLKETIEKSAEVSDDKGAAIDAATAGIAKIEDLWAEYTGDNKAPVRQWLANTGAAVRSMETASKLGSAMISAVPGDLGTQRITAKFNGLPFTRVLTSYLKLLNPASAEDRKLAVRMGLGFDGWTNHTAAQMRAFNSDLPAGFMSRLAEGVLRVQGLGVWTDAGNGANGFTVFGHMADVADRSFDRLDSGFRNMLDRYGIGAKEWDVIRATPTRHERGADWLFAQDVADQDLGDRLLAMAATESTLAVPVADLETRAAMSGPKAGTVKGELFKSSILFKSFGIALLLSHGRRMMQMANWSQRASYLVGTLATLTLAGAASIQLREIAKGRDPRPMDDWAFWGAAMLQGGGFGIVGDLLNLVVEPRIGSVAKYIAGPVADTAQNLAELGVASVKKMAGDRHANPGGKLVRTLQSELPGSNIWYARLAVQRLLLDHLSEAIDPNYRRSWRTMGRRALDQRTDYFWRPGEAASSARAPRISNAFEGAPQ